MKDIYGNQVKAGDKVHLILNRPMLFAMVDEVHDGGVLVQMGKNQQGQTGDSIKITFSLEMPLVDAPPGQNHPMLIRIINPETERIVPIGN